MNIINFFFAHQICRLFFWQFEFNTKIALLFFLSLLFQLWRTKYNVYICGGDNLRFSNRRSEEDKWPIQQREEKCGKMCSNWNTARHPFITHFGVYRTRLSPSAMVPLIDLIEYDVIEQIGGDDEILWCWLIRPCPLWSMGWLVAVNYSAGVGWMGDRQWLMMQFINFGCHCDNILSRVFLWIIGLFLISMEPTNLHGYLIVWQRS